MQGFEGKEKTVHTMNLSIRVTHYRVQHESNPTKLIGRRMPLPLHYHGIRLDKSNYYIYFVKAVKMFQTFLRTLLILKLFEIWFVLLKSLI